jgi:hypothetical protein
MGWGVDREKAVKETLVEKILTDRRTYFFDVKETREGSLYLVIGEVADVGNDTARHRVMVFEENIDAFLRALQNSVAHIKRASQPAPAQVAASTADDLDGAEPLDTGTKSGGAVREILGQMGFRRGKREQSDPDTESIKATLKRIESAVSEIREHFS